MIGKVGAIALVVFLPTAVAFGAHRDAPALVLLKNAEYRVSLGERKVQLTSGNFETGNSPSDYLRVTLHLAAFGDVNDDGIDDAAVILVQTTMGSGAFHDLAILTMEQGRFRQRGAVLLGDRVRIRSLHVRAGNVEVAMITHTDTDPACCPTRRVVRRYRLQDGVITEQQRAQ
jgi:hypothetical protein